MPVASGEVTGPVETDAGPIVPQPAAPAPESYVTEEFFIGGDATEYELVGDASSDGMWTAQPVDSAEYQTRILVRRPPAEDFSGVVIVEWLNVSAVEASPDWAYLSEEIGRSGHAYVAVSTQAQGVNGGETILDVEVDEEAAEAAGAESQELPTGGLVNADPERYGTLTHPGDAYAYDIFSQVGATLRSASDTVLGGLEPTTIVAVGESQSAGFLTTYVNAIHPLADVYDAFFIHSRGAGAPPLGGFEDGSSFSGEGVHIRTDLTEPVFMLETETDLTRLEFTAARQPDTETVRTWEVAGTAHSDAHVFRVFVGGPRDSSVGSIIGCDEPINTGPHAEAVRAAVSHLVSWANGGSTPPEGDPIEVADDEGADDEGTVVIVRDEIGMAIGGVRNPLVDVPVAVVTGEPYENVESSGGQFSGVCFLFGQTIPLDAETLTEMYGSADEYVAEFEVSADEAVEAGFLLPADAADLKEEAETNRALFS